MPTVFSQQSDVNRTSEDPNRRSQGAYHEAIDCALFATHGTHGVLDLGASKTVIGSQHLAGLIEGLDDAVRSKHSLPCDVSDHL